MWRCSEDIVRLFWDSWHLHLRYGFQWYHCWTVMVCWIYRLKCQQSKGIMWNFWCYRCLTFSTREWTILVNPELRLE
jgi:hypothetical protein